MVWKVCIFFPTCLMSANPDGLYTVVLMGAESTGKTTLAAALARHYKTVWSAEYLRLFVDRKGAVPEEEDVYEIARGHLDLISRIRSGAHRVMFADTDLFTTCVYQRIYFGICPSSVEELARLHRSGLYLFTEPDIPWISDPGQRAGPEARLRTHELLLEEAERHSLKTVHIHGSHDERMAVAIRAVDEALHQWMSFTKRNPT